MYFSRELTDRMDGSVSRERKLNLVSNREVENLQC